MFTGTYTAIVTPFKNGKLDEAALGGLIGLQIRAGVDGIVPVGTTGESPTVDYEEHVHIIERSVKFAGGKIKVLAGTGGNSTSEAIYLTERAEKVGVDTVKRLAQACKNIIGIKEAGGNADRVSQLRAALGPRFEILSGDDSLTLPFMAVGAQGVISVASNLIPRRAPRFVVLFSAGMVP